MASSLFVVQAQCVHLSLAPVRLITSYLESGFSCNSSFCEASAYVCTCVFGTPVSGAEMTFVSQLLPS